jgi:hypothetical protein
MIATELPLRFLVLFFFCAVVSVGQQEPIYCPPPTIELEYGTVLLDCSESRRAERPNCDLKEVRVRVNAVHPKLKKLNHEYRTSAGEVIGKGAEVIWNIGGLPPGAYDISVTVTGPEKFRRESTYTLTIQRDDSK